VSELTNPSRATVGRDLTPALYRAGVALGRTRNGNEVVRTAIAETQGAARLEAVALYVLDSERQVLVLKEFAGTSLGFRERMSLLPVEDGGPVARAIRGRRSPRSRWRSIPRPSFGRRSPSMDSAT
jgi:hypothetical protein